MRAGRRRILDAVYKNLCGDRVRILLATSHELKSVSSVSEAVSVVENLPVTWRRIPKIHRSELLLPVNENVGCSALRIGAANQPDLIAIELRTESRSGVFGNM